MHRLFSLFAVLLLPFIAASPTLAQTHIETSIAVSTTTGSSTETQRTQTRQVIRNGEVIVNESSTTSSPSGVRQQLQQLREQNRARVQELRQEFRSQRAKLHAQRLQRRFSWYYERLSDIALRTQARIDTQKTEGKDVTQAQASLTSGKTTLETAKTNGDKAISLFAAITVDTWDVQHPQIKAAIDQANLSRKGFADARKALMDAVRALATN